MEVIAIQDVKICNFGYDVCVTKITHQSGTPPLWLCCHPLIAISLTGK